MLLNNKTDSKLIYDTQRILKQSGQLPLIDKILFAYHKREQVGLLRVLLEIEEIKNNVDLNRFWKSVLYEYAKEKESERVDE